MVWQQGTDPQVRLNPRTRKTAKVLAHLSTVGIEASPAALFRRSSFCPAVIARTPHLRHMVRRIAPRPEVENQTPCKMNIAYSCFRTGWMAAIWIRGFSRAGPVTISVAGRHKRSQAPRAPPSQSGAAMNYGKQQVRSHDPTCRAANVVVAAGGWHIGVCPPGRIFDLPR